MAVPRRMASKNHLCLPKKGTHPFGRLDNSLRLRKSSHVTSSTKNRRASKSQSGVKGALGTFHGQQKSDQIGRSLSLILLEAAIGIGPMNKGCAVHNSPFSPSGTEYPHACLLTNACRGDAPNEKLVEGSRERSRMQNERLFGTYRGGSQERQANGT